MMFIFLQLIVNAIVLCLYVIGDASMIIFVNMMQCK